MAPVMPGNLCRTDDDTPTGRSCERGRRADLILLNSNPLDDVANVADREGVMVRGR